MAPFNFSVHYLWYLITFNNFFFFSLRLMSQMLTPMECFRDKWLYYTINEYIRIYISLFNPLDINWGEKPKPKSGNFARWEIPQKLFKRKIKRTYLSPDLLYLWVFNHIEMILIQVLNLQMRQSSFDLHYIVILKMTDNYSQPAFFIDLKAFVKSASRLCISRTICHNDSQQRCHSVSINHLKCGSE